MIVTTTPTVEGYHITQYVGTVTGAATYLIGGAFGEGLSNSRQSSMFYTAWQDAVNHMREAAYNADAIVGVQHSLCGVANGYMVVSVTGTAVRLTEDPVYRMQVDNVKREATERRARDEENARRSLEEFRREQERKKQETDAKKEQFLASLENGHLSGVPADAGERKKLADAISSAINLSFISKVRGRLKQSRTESGKEIFDYLLSLSDDELKPAAQIILTQLENQ